MVFLTLRFALSCEVLSTSTPYEPLTPKNEWLPAGTSTCRPSQVCHFHSIDAHIQSSRAAFDWSAAKASCAIVLKASISKPFPKQQFSHMASGCSINTANRGRFSVMCLNNESTSAFEYSPLASLVWIVRDESGRTISLPLTSRQWTNTLSVCWPWFSLFLLIFPQDFPTIG